MQENHVLCVAVYRVMNTPLSLSPSIYPFLFHPFLFHPFFLLFPFLFAWLFSASNPSVF